ncbi:hypothetical protein B0G71_7960 [Paraburkholderia sp. BL27I4N3]|nr:hypothetical protein B0G71_7960 [Paraburkholderia sp. BL27I4N3]
MRSRETGADTRWELRLNIDQAIGYYRSNSPDRFAQVYAARLTQFACCSKGIYMSNSSRQSVRS